MAILLINLIVLRKGLALALSPDPQWAWGEARLALACIMLAVAVYCYNMLCSPIVYIEHPVYMYSLRTYA